MSRVRLRRWRPATAKQAARVRIAQRILKGWPHPLKLGRIYRIPYRLLTNGTGRQLIHKGRKP